MGRKFKIWADVGLACFTYPTVMMVSALVI